MNPQSLKSYHDIRKLVSPGAFRCATNYMAWHNRLAMTEMLEVWEGLVVALACEQKPIDELQYSSTKSFLDQSRSDSPTTMLECQMRAELLARHLSTGT